MDSTAYRLVYAMQQRGMRNADVVETARRMGYRLTTSAVSQYVSGKYEPKQDKLYVLAKVLNVPALWLAGIAPLNEINGLQEEKDALEVELLGNFRKLNNDGKELLLSLSRYAVKEVKYTE